MGSDDIFNKKKKRRAISKIREERKLVLIALEDTKSSRFYFEKLIQDKGLAGKVTIAKNIGTDPNNVLNALLRHAQNNPKEKYI